MNELPPVRYFLQQNEFNYEKNQIYVTLEKKKKKSNLERKLEAGN